MFGDFRAISEKVIDMPISARMGDVVGAVPRVNRDELN